MGEGEEGAMGLEVCQQLNMNNGVRLSQCYINKLPALKYYLPKIENSFNLNTNNIL